ncbi:winged helix-turn-helix domain-containing protein [Micromonospora sp. NPDC005173]|uniref:winged helix-turn-helix domain-containing protein n=1 Tax=Micromonospora sp. NPDC005173 TaxID=3157165 RepID=UPI0033B50367
MPNRPADYLRVVNAITEQIESGELTPGDKLPTYAQLAEQYKVSVSTAQAALRILRDRGLVEGQQGKGTFVADRAAKSSNG